MVRRYAGGLSVLAPAKVNLFLEIRGRRRDGYHLLRSLMVPVSLYDRVQLRVERGACSRVVCRVTGPERVAGGDANLAVRAARAVLEVAGVEASVHIGLYKRIPVGAGLGGGSSDAAAVLRFLPELLGVRVKPAALLEIATALGADVPFFLACRPALVTGIGEVLSPLLEVKRMALVVAVPRTRVETSWAYATALKGLTSAKTATRLARSRLRSGDIEGLLHNDFERGVGRAVPDVGRLARSLDRLGARGTVMSGSGSAVVGLFGSFAQAVKAAGSLSRPDQAFAVRVLRRRPRRLSNGR